MGSARALACRLGRPAQGPGRKQPMNDSGETPESTREARVLPLAPFPSGRWLGCGRKQYGHEDMRHIF
jgi:hypothetical protein